MWIDWMLQVRLKKSLTLKPLFLFNHHLPFHLIWVKTETVPTVTNIVSLVRPAMWVRGCSSRCDLALECFISLKDVTASLRSAARAPVNQCLAVRVTRFPRRVTDEALRVSWLSEPFLRAASAEHKTWSSDQHRQYDIWYARYCV